MRSAFFFSAFVALVLAAPHPQAIEWGLVDAAPKAVPVAPPVDDGTVDTVPIQTVAEAVQIAAASVTSVLSTIGNLLGIRNGLSKRDGDCSVLPPGTGPTVNSTTSSLGDTPEAFLSYSLFAAAATGAAEPIGYTQVFNNLNASSQTTSYLGYTTLTTYDPALCASFCEQTTDDCIAFNLYFERDPSVEANATNCPNPSSVTNIKCAIWGVQIDGASATNSGQYRDSFEIVITGSNGYNKNYSPPPQSGYTGPVALNGAINAPNDPITNKNTYMGYKFYSYADVQTYTNGVAACITACSDQTSYNAAHPPLFPAKPSVCNQVVIYALNDNNAPQGIYCSMYTESWDPQYGTNVGQYRGSDYWSVTEAFSFTLSSYRSNYPQDICALSSCPTGNYLGGNCGGYGPGTC